MKLLWTSSRIEKLLYIYWISSSLTYSYGGNCTWDNDGISRCVMLWISPAGCCARVTIDWNIIFWIWIDWNDGDWLNVFSEDKFFNLNVKCNQLLSADINLHNRMCRISCECDCNLQSLTHHFNESIIIINTSCVVLWMSIELLDSSKIVIALPDICS